MSDLPAPPMPWRVLNLGCGMRTFDSPGVLNVDLYKHSDAVDEVWDLNDLPWPWEDESFDEVCARAVLEHLRVCTLDTINECWRGLRMGGLVDIKLPYWKAEESYNDLQHRWFAGLGIFDALDPRKHREHIYQFYTDKKWLIERVSLNQGRTSVVGRLRKIDVWEAEVVRQAWMGPQADCKRVGAIVHTWLSNPKEKRALTEFLHCKNPGKHLADA